METLKTIVIAFVISVVVLGGGLIVLSSTLKNEDGTPKVSLSALSSPDIPSGYLKWGGGNGVRIWSFSQSLNTAASTTCAILSPNATSTLLSAGVKFDVASSTAAMSLDLARGINQYSTTTMLGTMYTVGSGAQAFINASTSPGASAAEVFPPNTYFVAKFDTAVGANTAPRGACQAIFVEYPTISA